MALDLTGASAEIIAGRQSATALMRQSIAAAEGPQSRHAFLSTSFEAALQSAAQVDVLLRDKARLPALAGLAISVKDLFDVEGEPTTAGSAVLMGASPAATDAPAVARLRAASAALIGRTNMSEFAFSGVGINPHHGTPANPTTAAIDPVARIPGGSTSGGAVSVASGAAWAALGSDTGGSIRIPAALQGLVGFKNTARLTPSAGAFPLSTTLDTICAITRSVRDATLLHEVLGARPVPLKPRPDSAWRFGIPTTLMLDAMDTDVRSAFERAVNLLRAAGAQVEEVVLPELAEVAGINAAGGFPAAESWAVHRHRLATEADRYDPRVALRMRRGEAMSAADYIDLLHARRGWMARVESALSGFDAMLSPTVPCIAPLLAPLLTDDVQFFATNALLLRNPSVVNLLDGCAISLPCQAAGEMPVGLMAWSAALQDETVEVGSVLAVVGEEGASAPAPAP